MKNYIVAHNRKYYPEVLFFETSDEGLLAYEKMIRKETVRKGECKITVVLAKIEKQIIINTDH